MSKKTSKANVVRTETVVIKFETDGVEQAIAKMRAAAVQLDPPSKDTRTPQERAFDAARKASEEARYRSVLARAFDGDRLTYDETSLFGGHRWKYLAFEKVGLPFAEQLELLAAKLEGTLYSAREYRLRRDYRDAWLAAAIATA